MLRLAILASGSGSNLQAILEAYSAGRLGKAVPILVVADRVCTAIGRAENAGVEAVVLNRRDLGRQLSDTLGRVLVEHRIDMVALAGWLSILDANFVLAWKGRIINIHPSLLPRHGGPGMYGERVHRSVLESGDTESGCSVHHVTKAVDGGELLACSRIRVLPDDTAGSLAARVLVEEHRLYPRVIAELSETLVSEQER